MVEIITTLSHNGIKHNFREKIISASKEHKILS
jgi:hypothetical protein